MASQEKLDIAYMECAFAIAKLSYAVRRKVGAIMVALNGGIIAEGYNGTFVGFDNNCEDEVYGVEIGSDKPASVKLVTRPEVIHAESNAILKIARSTNSSVGSTMYLTLSPCFECAKLIIQAGIKRVVYSEKYRITTGLELLDKAGIRVDELMLSSQNNFEKDLHQTDEGYIDPLDKREMV